MTNELKVEAKIENLPSVIDFVMESLDVRSRKARLQLELAIEEIFVNIANYSYPDGNGSVSVIRETVDSPFAVRVTFIDSGIPFDPTMHEDPDINLPANQRKIGGLGIFLVKKYTDEISYEHREGKNIFTMLKLIGEEET